MTVSSIGRVATAFFSVLLIKERNVLFRSFFEFLATYKTQKDIPFFSILF